MLKFYLKNVRFKIFQRILVILNHVYIKWEHKDISIVPIAKDKILFRPNLLQNEVVIHSCPTYR